MKKLLSFLLCLTFALCSSVAFAAGIQINNLSETKLYALYSEVQSQLLLNKLENVDAYKPVTDYDDIERNPNKHTGEKLYFEGTVLQVVEGTTTTYRIATNQYGDNVFLVTYSLPEDSERFLENDAVCVYAEFIELNTYNSTTNLSVTVPYCTADLIIRPIKTKTVPVATDEELEEALSAIRTRLNKVVAKDKEYSKLTKTNYEDFARHEKLHENEKLSFSGKVMQVVENSWGNAIRLAVDSDTDKIIYLTYDPDLISIRVLDDDILTVKGTYSGLYTYSSIRSGDITIPSATVESLDVKGFKAPANFPKDKDGNAKVTKALYEDYARRPSEHENEAITFSGKVIQVIEGDSVSSYRIAVDSNSDCIFLVDLANDDRVMRILEDDKVTVVGTFDGLIAYESTLGATITIPQCTAASIVIPGKVASVVTKDANGNYKVAKTNYESLARDENTYQDKPLTFTAKVIQVVDSDETNIYRLAVDQSSDAMILGVINTDDLDVRILEDDIVTIEATSTGLYSYSSTLGGKITIPSCLITNYSIVGYVKQDVGDPDSDGYYKITKKSYDEIARNPNSYQSQKITFRGKVVQVVEGTGGDNVYRVAVDSDSNCMFYVEYSLPSGASRILKNDIVTLKGTYFGIYTYQTTLGGSVSVPALLATEITK